MLTHDPATVLASIRSQLTEKPELTAIVPPDYSWRFNQYRRWHPERLLFYLEMSGETAWWASATWFVRRHMQHT